MLAIQRVTEESNVLGSRLDREEGCSGGEKGCSGEEEGCNARDEESCDGVEEGEYGVGGANVNPFWQKLRGADGGNSGGNSGGKSVGGAGGFGGVDSALKPEITLVASASATVTATAATMLVGTVAAKWKERAVGVSADAGFEDAEMQEPDDGLLQDGAILQGGGGGGAQGSRYRHRLLHSGNSSSETTGVPGPNAGPDPGPDAGPDDTTEIEISPAVRNALAHAEARRGRNPQGLPRLANFPSDDDGDDGNDGDDGDDGGNGGDDDLAHAHAVEHGSRGDSGGDRSVWRPSARVSVMLAKEREVNQEEQNEVARRRRHR